MGQLIRGELVGDVVAEFVLRSVVVFFLVDQREGAAFARVRGVEGAREKFDAFTQAFDDAEALVVHGALDHLDHVVDLGGVRPGDEARPGADELFHRVHRLVDRAGRVGLRFETDGRRGRGLLLGQAIDEVVHDEVDQVDVLARAVIEMVAADGEAVAVAAEEKDVQVGPGQADAGRERDGAAVNEMRAVAVHEIREARGTTDPGEGDDLLVIELPFLEDFVIGSEHREVAAARTPGGVIGRYGLFCELLAGEIQHSCSGGRVARVGLAVCRRHACRYRRTVGGCVHFSAH